MWIIKQTQTLKVKKENSKESVLKKYFFFWNGREFSSIKDSALKLDTLERAKSHMEYIKINLPFSKNYEIVKL